MNDKSTQTESESFGAQVINCQQREGAMERLEKYLTEVRSDYLLFQPKTKLAVRGKSLGSPEAPQRKTTNQCGELEDDLRRQLHIATTGPIRLDVALAHVVAAIVDEHVRVIEQIEHFAPKLECHALGELDSLVNGKVQVPESRTVELVPLRRVGRERAKVVIVPVCAHWERINHRSTGVAEAAQVDVSERIRRSRTRGIAANGNRTRWNQAPAGCIGVRAIIDRERISRSDREDAVRTPTTQHLTLNRATRLAKPARLVIGAADETVSDVIVGMTIVIGRNERIGEPEEERLSTVREGRAQVILRNTPRISSRKRQACVTEVVAIKRSNQRSVIRVSCVSALIGAGNEWVEPVCYGTHSIIDGGEAERHIGAIAVNIRNRIQLLACRT